MTILEQELTRDAAAALQAHLDAEPDPTLDARPNPAYVAWVRRRGELERRLAAARQPPRRSGPTCKSWDRGCGRASRACGPGRGRRPTSRGRSTSVSRSLQAT